jgi:phage FluMu protein Com
MPNLIDIRCPLKRKDTTGKICNRLCVRVEPGSSGQVSCPRCNVPFEFKVDDNSAFNDIITYREPSKSA